MNNLIRKTFTKSSLIIIALLALAVGPMKLVQADVSGGRIVISGLSDEVIKALTNIYADLYNKVLKNYTDLAYEFDPQIPITVVSENAQNTANTAVDKAVQEQSAKMVSNAFSGTKKRTQAQLALLQQPAEDDAIEGAAGKGLFSRGDDAFKAENAKASLLGPETYSDQTAMNNAQAFLAQVKSLAPPPPVIRLAPKFDVPITNPDDPSQDTATMGDKKALSSDQLKKMRDTLAQDKEYRDYKLSYRGVVAARSIYLNNLLRGYQERVPQVNGKSALQIRKERINGRLSQGYYDKMSKASPATVARETLFVLAEISRQLNALQKQQNLMIEMDSISGLNQLVLGSNMLNMQAKDIGQMLYCMDPGHKKEKICVSDTETDQEKAARQKRERGEKEPAKDRTNGLKKLITEIPGM
jgi:hypothetical protein